jgi:hypothetical protein
MTASGDLFQFSFGDLCPSHDREAADAVSHNVVSGAEVATAGKLSG